MKIYIRQAICGNCINIYIDIEILKYREQMGLDTPESIPSIGNSFKNLYINFLNNVNIKISCLSSTVARSKLKKLAENWTCSGLCDLIREYPQNLLLIAYL